MMKPTFCIAAAAALTGCTMQNSGSGFAHREILGYAPIRLVSVGASSAAAAAAIEPVPPSPVSAESEAAADLPVYDDRTDPYVMSVLGISSQGDLSAAYGVSPEGRVLLPRPQKLDVIDIGEITAVLSSDID